MNSSSLRHAETMRLLHRAFRATNAKDELRVRYSMMLRYLHEQIHPLGMQDVRLAQYVQGTDLLVDVGDRLGADVFYGYFAEIGDLVLLQRVCPNTGTAVDVGANCGYFSLLVTAGKGFQGRLVAVEPVTEAAALLERNLASSRSAKLAIRRECLGRTDGETEFHVAQESAFSGISDTGRSKILRIERVKQLKLDTMLRELGIGSIDVVKIDVEGHEADVIEGAAETLSRSPELVALVEISSKNLSAERHEKLVKSIFMLKDLGFRAWQIDRRFHPTALVAVEHPEAFDSFDGGNIFFVRADSHAEKKLHLEFADMRESVEGRSYLNGYILPDDASSEDLVELAERLSLRALTEQQAERMSLEQALTEQQAERMSLEQAHAKLKEEHTRLQEECGRLKASLWFRIARFVGGNR